MEMNLYQNKAKETAIYPDQGNNLVYPTLGLASEAGELCGKVKKLIRDDNYYMTPELKERMKQELGDNLWYIALIAFELDTDLETIAQMNLNKLAERKKNDTLRGSGDDR